MPLDDAISLNQVPRAPDVINGSYGQLHVRGDHADVQYRINGVIIPESISDFGQAVDTRVIDSLPFLTGDLPAQYGYRTADIVDITTRFGANGNDTHTPGGSIDVTTGSFGTWNPNTDFHGNNGPWSGFVTANYQQDDTGIENPTALRDALRLPLRFRPARRLGEPRTSAAVRRNQFVGQSRARFVDAWQDRRPPRRDQRHRPHALRYGSGIGVGTPQYDARRGVYVGLRKDF